MRGLIAEMRELLIEKMGRKERVVVYNGSGPYPFVMAYSSEIGDTDSAVSVGEGEVPPSGKVAKKDANKLAKKLGIKTVITFANWQKLMAFDKHVLGMRVIPISHIDWKKMPTTAALSKLSIPRITTYKWTPSAAKIAKAQGITPTFGLKSPYKKDFIAAFGTKIPKEAKFWDKFNKEWVVDKSYEPLVIMLIHEYFFVDPEEFGQDVANPMDKALYADRKTKVGGKPAGELSITKDPSGWYIVTTPWNAAYLKALKASFEKKDLKWDKVNKAWRVKAVGGTKDILLDLIKKHYKKTPTVLEGRRTMGELIDELRCVA